MKNTIILLLAFFSLSASAQELLCNVKVQTPKLNKVDPAVFRTLESELSEFMNNRQWTSRSYSNNEKIECSFNITIVEEISSTQFGAEVTIEANRPVFNSNYKSLLFLHQDKDWQFTYTEFQPLEYDENGFVNNLTSMMAYYAYMIIGYDYDSFTDQGGTPYFQKAEDIVNRGQSAAEPGWKPNDNNKRRNRYWMVTNMLSPRFKKLRTAYYNYHRKGLDMMYENPQEARKNLVSALESLKQSHQENPNTIAIKVFTVTKNEEILDVFADASVAPPDKMKVKNIMSLVDPSTSSKFDALTKFGGKADGQYSPRSGQMPKRGGR